MSRSRVIRLDEVQQFQAINLLSDPGHVGGDFVMPNGINILLGWTLAGGKSATNVLWASVSGSFVATATVADNLLSAITAGSEWTALAGHLSTTTRMASVKIRDRRALGQLPVSSTGAGALGTNAGLALPNEVALVGTIRTARGGPAGRGRIYVPGYAVDQVIAGNLVSATAVTDTTTWLNRIMTSASGGGMTLQLGHPPRSQYTGSTGTVHPQRSPEMVPITQILVRNNTWDSQRRRGLK